MPSLIDLPDLVTALVGRAVLTGTGVTWQRLRTRRTPELGAPSQAPRQLRRYTLLRTTGVDGTPDRYETTRPPGTVITHRVSGLPQRFELTDAPLGDGTYAAEPLDPL
ncbi:hypothetical protein [Streptomyces sp. NPDC002853]